MLQSPMIPTRRSRPAIHAAVLTRNAVLASTMLFTVPGFGWAEPIASVYDGANNQVTTDTNAVGNGTVYVGYEENGWLTISNGAVLSGVAGYVGQSSGVTGEVTVTGSQTTWETSGGLYVGNLGEGTLNVESGAILKSRSGELGSADGSTGIVTVSGQGSIWEITEGLQVGYRGVGQLIIEDGGTVIGQNAYVGSGYAGSGTALVTGAGSTWTNSNVLNIGGVTGDAALVIVDGGVAKSKWGYIGMNSDQRGTTTVTGDGSEWRSSEGLYVGFEGQGSLNIENSGFVESNEVTLGLFAGSNGSATVTGAGSELNSNNLYVGNWGNGTLTVEDGGLVKSTYGHVGAVSGSNGFVTVSGVGSTWQNVSNIFVGEQGSGTLDIKNGGLVESNTTIIGKENAATGKVTVADNGSKWSDGGNIFVGYAGNGTLDVIGGGVAEDKKGFIGYYEGSTGVATVSGSESVWKNSSSLSVGDSGTGTLIIANDGVVSVGTQQQDGTFDGTTYIAKEDGSKGTLVIGAAEGSDATGAGSLKTDTIKFNQSAGLSNGTIVFNHTESDYLFSANMKGYGEIRHLSGVTTLSGDSADFSGLTNVDGGNLYVSGALGGTINVSSGGTIGGVGTIGTTTIEDGGILSPGGLQRIIYSRSVSPTSGVIGTLTIDGDLVLKAGSTYAVDFNGTDADLTQVLEKAFIEDGAGVKVTALDSETSYQKTQTYKIISTGTGLTGKFSGLVNTASAFLDITNSYDADNAYLNVSLKSSGNGNSGVFVPVANSSNQRSVASALDTLDQTSGSASLGLYNSLLMLDAEQARKTFQQLSGDIYATARGTFVQTNRAVSTALNSRVRAVTDGVAAPSSMALGYSDEEEGAPKDDRFAAYETRKPFDSDRFATWINGFGSWGKVSGVNGESDTDISNGGALVGGDVAISNDWRVGVLGGYSRTFFDTDSSKGDSTNYHLGAYSGTKWGPVALRSGVNYTWHNIDTSRNVSALGQTLYGNYDASSFNVYGELAYRLDVGTSALEPFAALAHSRTKTDGFSETGGSAALTVDSSSMNTTFSTLGLRTSTDFDLAGVASVARGTIGWLHAFGDVDPVSSARFLTGDSFAVSSTPVDRNAVLLEAGVDFTITPASTLSFTYNGQIGSNAYEHGANAKLRVKF
ncbi:autotransporter domain-containing protein [Agrobacterium sp. 22-3674b3]